MSTISYIRNFIKDRDVASLTPTNTHTVKNICDKIDFSNDMVLVEYGPGEGVFTDHLLERLSAGSRLITVESNENFARSLAENIHDPRLQVVHGLAGNIRAHLDEFDIGNVDYVLSGIPFSFLEYKRRVEVIQRTLEILKPGGTFIAYQMGNHLKPILKQVFGTYSQERELLNIPPYKVFRAIKDPYRTPF